MKCDEMVYNDKKYHFMEVFNRKTGRYIRTGIIEDGRDTGVDSFMRSFPGLLDIGIMGGCKAARLGVCRAGGSTSGCYQGGKHYNPDNDMKLSDYQSIIDQGAESGLMQVALGGAGNPNDHLNFKEICEYTRLKGIVPNYTTAGIELTDEMVGITKEYCGAVAVSWYGQEFTFKAINQFLAAGCKTNIHYVLSKETINDAIEILKNHKISTLNNEILDFENNNINAIIFLLYKPVGLGTIDNILTIKDDKKELEEFFQLVSSNSHPFKIGFDSCSIPAILNFSKNINLNSVDTCEGGRFSAYITPDMVMLPCSFDQKRKWGVSLKEHTVQEAWDSEQFDDFRNHMKNSCSQCKMRENCMGGCPIKPEIVLCDSKEEK